MRIQQYRYISGLIAGLFLAPLAMAQAPESAPNSVTVPEIVVVSESAQEREKLAAAEEHAKEQLQGKIQGEVLAALNDRLIASDES